MSYKDKLAYNKVVKARTVMIMKHGFFGCLAMQLKLVEVEDKDEVDTMAVDGIHMYYHPPFIHKLSEDELQGVVAHEVMHCAYKHMTRRQHREPERWNWAGDFIINMDVVEAGFKLPGTPSYQMKGQVTGKPTGPCYLYDPQYKGMSTEEVYEKLPKPLIIMLMAMGAGKGQGKNTDPTGCGGVRDAAKQGDTDKAQAIEREWEGNVRMAVSVARANNAGKTPGYLQRLVDELERPKVNWREQTRDFIDNSQSKDFSFARPNRRNASTGMVLPGYISDRLSHLVMFIDNSGSIDEPMLKAFVSEVGGALDDGTCDKVTVVYADDGVRHIDEFMSGDLVTAKVLGGGGTNFRPAFNWLMENAPDASCVIYLTDMMTTDFGDDPGLPVLWGVTLPEQSYEQYAYNAPFGVPIRVDISQ